MPTKFILNSICITIFGTFVGYGATHMAIKGGQSNSLEMASLAPNENPHRISKLASQQIYQDYFDIRIKHDVIATTEDGQSVVKAIVTAKKDLPAGLSFQWKLGENVTSNSGEISGKLGAIKRGEKQEVLLPVYGFNKQSKKYLSFVVSGKVDSHDLHKESLSSSRPEDSFEYVVQQAHQLEQERAQEEAKQNNGKVKTKSVRSKKFDPENIIK
jgi:hypothetical protein